MSVRDNLKKALHRAILKAYQNGKASSTVDKIVSDIEDPDYIAEVPQHEIPAPSQNVLHKDITLSEIHQKKQANAMASLGQPPKMPSQKMSVATAASSSESASSPKGMRPLKSFMQKKEGKRSSIYKSNSDVSLNSKALGKAQVRLQKKVSKSEDNT